MKEEKTIFKHLAGIEPHISGLLVRRVNHYMLPIFWFVSRVSCLKQTIIYSSRVLSVLRRPRS